MTADFFSINETKTRLGGRARGAGKAGNISARGQISKERETAVDGLST